MSAEKSTLMTTLLMISGVWTISLLMVKVYPGELEQEVTWSFILAPWIVWFVGYMVFFLCYVIKAFVQDIFRSYNNRD
jgi:predicted membrane-bound spermidine synthase